MRNKRTKSKSIPRNRWNRPGVPHLGWKCVGVTDLWSEQGVGYAPASCEMCGKEKLRYVHRMRHKGYPKVLNVGCICAGKMEGNAEAPMEREQRLKSRSSRKSRFAAARWRLSQNGNQCRKIDGFIVTIFANQLRPCFCFSIGRNGGRPEFWNGFDTIEDAKLAAFDRLEKLRRGD